VAWVDLKYAFEFVDRSAVWLALQGISTPDTVLNLFRDLHSGIGARVRVGLESFDRFTITYGVRQWCILAPARFCRATDWIMEHMSGLKNVPLGRYTVTDLDCADDIALPVPQLPDLET